MEHCSKRLNKKNVSGEITDHYDLPKILQSYHVDNKNKSITNFQLFVYILQQFKYVEFAEKTVASVFTKMWKLGEIWGGYFSLKS